jgi:hypothetical protein
MRSRTLPPAPWKGALELFHALARAERWDLVDMSMCSQGCRLGELFTLDREDSIDFDAVIILSTER